MSIKPVDDESVSEVESPVDCLLRLASAARLYRSADGRLHARVPIGDRHEIYGLNSAAFQDWLTEGYFAARREPPSVWATRRVIALLYARARFDGGTPSVCVRVGAGHDSPDGGDSTFFLDLGDRSGQAVRIDAGGWRVVDRPEVHFRRPEGQLPLPVPSHEGSVDFLRPYVNVRSKDMRLLIAWITAALRPVGPYPILSLHGEQGSAKSTVARVIRLLVDPQVCPLLAEPRSTQDLMATAINGWLLAYDNISVIPNWLSDSLCRLVFGGGFAARTLFSNDERSIIHAQRPVILNGIDDFVRRGDLVDRTVFLHLPPIPPYRRRSEDEFWKLFHADYPLILGGLLDAIVAGLRAMPSVNLAELPRMADFACWGEAVGQGLGWEAGSFLASYKANRTDATMPQLEDSAIAVALLGILPRLDQWAGTPAELHEMLTKVVGKKIAASARWPKATRIFSNDLRRLAPQLRMHGLTVSFGKTASGRLIMLTKGSELLVLGPGIKIDPMQF